MICLIVAVSMIAIGIGASKKYRFHGIKLQKVEIIAPGELFSTYTFTEGENALVKEAVHNDEALFSEIEKGHLEDAWPDPMNDFNWRIGHPDVIRRLVGYKLCNLEGDRCLLVIPMQKNKHVTQVALVQDIYFVIRKTGIK